MSQRAQQARRAVVSRARQPATEIRARVRLRDARLDETPQLVALINDAYRPVDWWLFEQLRTSEAELRETMSLGRHQTVVAELDGRLVGHARLWIFESGEWTGAWLGMLASATPGHGIGTLLVEETERRASAAGYDILKLDCVRENGLEDYYTALGFVTVREERGRMRDAKYEWTRVYMTKDLP